MEHILGTGGVAAAVGDVKIAGVAQYVDNGATDGDRLDWPVAGAAGGMGFAETDVSDVVDHLDAPVFAHESG